MTRRPRWPPSGPRRPSERRGQSGRGRRPGSDRCATGDPALLRWLAWLLAVSLVVYAIQASYSSDFQQALQNVVFFYVPFAVLYSLLREIRWTPGMLRAALTVAVGLGIVFSLVGFVEYATKTILLNPKLITTNNLHAYFTVNSLFYDPNIFGRYLSLVMILLVAGLLYNRQGRALWMTLGALVVMWACLLLTLSRTSLAALLLGLAVLAALRWKPSRALVAAVAVIIVGAAAVAASPHTFGLEQGFNGVSGGRGGLVSGGVSLFGDRPGWGYGSGSFVTEYRVAPPQHRHDPVGVAHDPHHRRRRAGAHRARRLRAAADLRVHRRAAPQPWRPGALGGGGGVHRAGVPHAAVRELPGGPDDLGAARGGGGAGGDAEAGGGGGGVVVAGARLSVGGAAARVGLAVVSREGSHRRAAPRGAGIDRQPRVRLCQVPASSTRRGPHPARARRPQTPGSSSSFPVVVRAARSRWARAASPNG